MERTHPAGGRKNELPEEIRNRKGSRFAKDIPSQVLSLLQAGELETRNLTEWLAVDHLALLENVLADWGMSGETKGMPEALRRQEERKIMRLIPTIAKEWLRLFGSLPKREAALLFARLAEHRSDSVRCWAAYIVGLDDCGLEERLASIRPFAADSHFGVREIAWMAVRDSIAADLETALRLLACWVREEDPNLRRFAVEATRPRGVWAKHIKPLQSDPGMAMGLLEAVRSDPSKYVQDSVGNWLNDASKTDGEWVIRTCSAWLADSDTEETRRIAARARRSMPMS